MPVTNSVVGHANDWIFLLLLPAAVNLGSARRNFVAAREIVAVSTDIAIGLTIGCALWQLRQGSADAFALGPDRETWTGLQPVRTDDPAAFSFSSCRRQWWKYDRSRCLYCASGGEP